MLRPWQTSLAATALVVSGCSAQDASPATPATEPPRPTYSTNQVTDPDARQDEFGLEYLYPSLEKGNYWVSNWQDEDRRFTRNDPADSWFDTDAGTATYEVEDGRLKITGPTSRMYVHDPAMKRQWGDVEITVYAKRLRDDGVPYSGIATVARTNHLQAERGTSPTPCDTRGYGGRFRFDGRSDFEKETSHPKNDAVSERALFGTDMPRKQWIGYKFVVYDVGDNVRLELWADFTNGKDGGAWTKVNSFTDSGDDFGVVPCHGSIDPMDQLTNDTSREGSESGLPNVSVYFRADGVRRNGLHYKWASVREISPPG